MIIKKSQKGHTKRYKKNARKRSKEPSWHKKNTEREREKKTAFNGPVM